MIRCLVLAFLLWPVNAKAYPCWMIKQAVAQYGEAAVESWARSKGMTEREIDKARKCLKAQ